MIRELRQAARSLRRQPGFAALAVVILALGLGAAVAAFSLVNAAVLRPLPFPAPDRLVRVNPTTGPERRQAASLPPALLREYRAHNDVFQGMAAVELGPVALVEPGQPADMVWSLKVTADFFDLLGVKPALGRVLAADEDQPGRHRVAVVSWAFWQGRLGGDPGVIGRSLRLAGEPVTVVGVMPAAFNDPLRKWTRVELWRPMAFSPRALDPRSTATLEVFARLKPGVTLAQGEQRMSALAARLDPAGQRSVRLKLLGDKSVLASDGDEAVWLTLGLAVFVLLIACFNLVGVQLARLIGRGHEQAIRAALGASRGRLLREQLAESLLLSALGGALGVLVAVWLVGLVAGRMVVGGFQATVGIPVALDLRVAAFAVAAALLCALVVGTGPAWLHTRGPLWGALRRGGPATTDRGWPRLRQALVVAEMALALALLAGGGLFLRGLDRFFAAHPGWRVDGLLTARLVLPPSRYPDAGARAAFLRRLDDRLAGLPGTGGHALAAWLPISPGTIEQLAVEGAPELAGAAGAPPAFSNVVSPAYFQTLAIPLREGRLLGAGDTGGSLPVAVINETMARQLWPGGGALGRRIATAAVPGAPARWATVVGVVGDVAFTGELDDPKARFQVYRPLGQQPLGAPTIALRTRGEPAAAAADLRRAVAELDPELPVYEPLSARGRSERYLRNHALTGWVMFGLAGLGLLLAALGVYGLFAGFVAERRREIGVRLALGARSAQVLGLVLGKGLRLALLGTLLGTAGAAAAMQVLRAVAHQLPAHEPLAVVVLAAALVAVALFACWLPARRAAAVDPMVALRHD